jgi:hypothetical protein
MQACDQALPMMRSFGRYPGPRLATARRRINQTTTLLQCTSAGGLDRKEDRIVYFDEISSQLRRNYLQIWSRKNIFPVAGNKRHRGTVVTMAA